MMGLTRTTMKQIRFYLEFPSPAAKRRGTVADSCGTVFAMLLDIHNHPLITPSHCAEGLGAVFDRRNSPVASTAAHVRKHLARLCKRIPEAKARQVHPALFTWLDAADARTEAAFARLDATT